MMQLRDAPSQLCKYWKKAVNEINNDHDEDDDYDNDDYDDDDDNDGSSLSTPILSCGSRPTGDSNLQLLLLHQQDFLGDKNSQFFTLF